jgi:predicted phage tail protein
MEVLLILGLPLGEFTMGGRHKVLPGPYRIAAASSILLQIFGALMMLQGAGFMNMWFGATPTKVICFVFGGFFAVNTVMNFISPSKKEKYVMTPLALIEAVCFIVTAVKM